MSAINRVVEEVKKRGEATVAQIAPSLPDLTYKQVVMAVENAKTGKKLAVKVRGSAKAKRQTTWVALEFTPQRRKPPTPRFKPVTSVWDMADREQISGAWPPPFEMARKFNLLGSWDV